jgi:uncharacterized membrane protein (Fun14 family)
MTNTPPPQQGLFDTAINTTGLGGFIEKFNISKATLLEIGMYLGIGFVVGFLLKRCSKLFLVLVLTILIIWFLHHVGIVFVVVNWQKIQELIFGAQATPLTLQTDLGSNLWHWITNHVAGSISFVIGFLAGIRLG